MADPESKEINLVVNRAIDIFTERNNVSKIALRGQLHKYIIVEKRPSSRQRVVPPVRFGVDEFFRLLAAGQPNASNTPLNSFVLSQLPTQTFEDQKLVDSLSKTCNGSCPVCFESYKLSECRIFLPCTHSFHKTCIIPWFQTNNTCPVCKTVVNSN